MKTKAIRPRCHNCKYAGEKFKVYGLTHLHCIHPNDIPKHESGEFGPWDSLREFWNTCELHELIEVVNDSTNYAIQETIFATS